MLAEDAHVASSNIGIVGCWIALVAAFLFAIVSSDPGTAGEGCQREIYMNTLILAAWYLVIRRHEGTEARRHDDRLLVAAGLCLGLASLIKTVVAVHWVALVIGVLWSGRSPWNRSRTVSGPSSLLSFSLLAVGPSLIWGSTFLYFAVTDRFSKFFDAVFTFNLGYSGDKSLLARVVGFFTPDRHPFIFDSALPLWIAGAIAAVALSIHLIVKRDMRSLSVLSLVAASFVAVCLPGRSWPHYYYLMIPPLVICVGCAMGVLAQMFGGIEAYPNQTGPIKHGHASVDHATHPYRQRGAWGCVLPMTLFGIVLAGTFYTQYHDYLSEPPFGITVKRYNSRDFWGRGQGDNVRSVTDPADTVFVYGNEASIYYYAQRRCASRYTMITGLADGMPGAEARRATLMEELRASPPRLILVLPDQQPFDEWRAFLHEHYGEPIGWDRHDKTGGPIMFVLARNDAPAEPINWDWDRSSVGGWQLGEEPR